MPTSANTGSPARSLAVASPNANGTLTAVAARPHAIPAKRLDTTTASGKTSMDTPGGRIGSTINRIAAATKAESTAMP